jgi:CDP-diacylglycerol--glycerol-3-phosphate 3-phosphatidyltransferase
MLNLHARDQLGRLLEPVGRRLARTGITPDAITVVGTIGVAGGALGFYTRGVFFPGTLVIVAFVFSDLLDGTLARARGTSGPWGAFLDSAMDRIGDAAVFGSLVIWYAGRGHSLPLAGAALAAMAGGFLTSYARARAESLGFTCNVGFAERAERLIVILAAAGLCGLRVPYVLPGAVWFLAAATAVTAGQRLVDVHRQASRAPAALASPALTEDRDRTPASR